MQSYRSLAAIVLLLAGCQPRAPAAVGPEPLAVLHPAPPPESLAIERLETARHLYDEGVMLGRRSLWGEAAGRFGRAAELDPGAQRYHLAHADALAHQGRDGEAADALQRAIRLEEESERPNHRVLVVDYERLVRYLTRANRLDEARVAAERQEAHRRLRDAAP